MTAPLRAAIIGCGPSTPKRGGARAFGYAHAWAYAAVPGVELVAAATRTPQNLADFQAEFAGVHGYQDYQVMLLQERPDLVSICAYPPDREAMVLAALDAGASGVWIEKPFALSLGSARRMMAEAEARGARLFVNHQRRYGTPFAWLKEAAEMHIGQLQSIRIAQPGPNLLDFGPHLVDTALFCLGARQAVQVCAVVDRSVMGTRHGVPVERHAVASIHFDDGVRLLLEAGTSLAPNIAPAIRVDGSDGFAELHLDVPPGGQSIFRARYAGEAAVINPATDEHFHHSADPALYVKRALRDMVRALHDGGPTRIDVSEAYRGLEIILAIYESGRRGCLLPLPLAQEAFPLELEVAHDVA